MNAWILPNERHNPPRYQTHLRKRNKKCSSLKRAPIPPAPNPGRRRDRHAPPDCGHECGGLPPASEKPTHSLGQRVQEFTIFTENHIARFFKGQLFAKP